MRSVSLTRLLFAAILCVGALGGSVERGTVAYFTDSAGGAPNQFTTGTVRLSAGIAVGSLSIANLVPGDGFNAQLTIHNAGNLDLRYSMSSSTSGSSALAGALTVTVSTCGASPTILYSGPLSAAAFGNPAYGQQSGDRTLTAGSSEPLCFTVGLPAGTSPTVQGSSTMATFTFAAEQL